MMDARLRDSLQRLQGKALAVGLLGGVGVAIWAFLDSRQFYQSYLLGYLFWLSISLGSLGLVMLHHLVGGGWSFLLRRPLEAAARTVPLMALLFVPVLLGMGELYHWTHAEEVASHPMLSHKAPYLNTPFFLARTALYFGVWLLLSFLVTRWSLQQDRTADLDLTVKLKKVSGPGILLYALTLTFASVDWVMSLEPEWFSTIYGLLFLVGHGLGALTFMILGMRRLSSFEPYSQEPFAHLIHLKYYHDWGNLTLAFVMLWAYLSFSQYLIIWSANLPEEIPWYLHRVHTDWQLIALFLLLFHFAIPFLLLLSRRTKRHGVTLAKVAAGLLLMRFVDLFWLVKPAFSPEGFSFHPLDLLIPLALGGLWLGVFTRQLQKGALLPQHDPRLEEAFGKHKVLHHG